MSDYYVLDANKNVVPATMREWGPMFRDFSSRRVGHNVVAIQGEAVRVSTVFLGIDHRLSGEGPPVVFETMIFGGKHNEYQTRCSTWNEAVEQHQVALDLVTEQVIA